MQTKENNQVISPEQFAEKLVSSKGEKFSFLLGNGVNHILLPSVVSWDQMLNSIAEQHGIKHLPGISNIDLCNIIELTLSGRLDFDDDENITNMKKKSASQRINKVIADFINGTAQPVHCDLIDFAWEKRHHILTTNFDDNIEAYLQKRYHCRMKAFEIKVPDIKGKYCRRDAHYKWNRFWSDSDGKKSITEIGDMPNGHDIWHIHGKVDKMQSCSLIASMTKYCSAIRKVAGMSASANNKDKWDGINSWLELFMNRPLIIAGLALEEQEIFPRYLLMRKAQKKEWLKWNQQSFYLVKKTDREAIKDGRNFLASLGFKIVEFSSYEEIYNNSLWNKFLESK